jgi:adhesin transport system outer membrane protein
LQFKVILSFQLPARTSLAMLASAKPLKAFYFPQDSLMNTLLRSALATIFLSVVATAAHAQSMTDVVKLTVENNPQIGVVSANRKAVEQELHQARGLYLPQVDVVTGIGPEHTNSNFTRGNTGGSEDLIRSDARISVTQRVFTGFETTNEVNRQKARVASAANRVYENAENIALDAVGSYLEVIRPARTLCAQQAKRRFPQGYPW